jgi:S-adenosyl methyltransferase
VARPRRVEGVPVTESPTGTGGQQQAPLLDTGVPQTARIWNYWLGGKDN